MDSEVERSGDTPPDREGGDELDWWAAGDSWGDRAEPSGRPGNDNGYADKDAKWNRPFTGPLPSPRPDASSLPDRLREVYPPPTRH
jgi:hypothetical protein